MSESLYQNDTIDQAEPGLATYGSGLINDISLSDWKWSWSQVQAGKTDGLLASPQAEDLLKSCPLAITIASIDRDPLSGPFYNRTWPLEGLVEETESDQVKWRLLKELKRQAAQNVEKSMSPQEKATLRDDLKKYEPLYKAWQDRVKVFAGLNPPPPPERPASLVRYERAVDEQVRRLLERAMKLKTSRVIREV